MKYQNLKEVAAAFQSGELDREKYTLILDNDDSFLQCTEPLPDGIEEGSDEADAWERKQHERTMSLFRGNGYPDLQDACEAAGIPCEWC